MSTMAKHSKDPASPACSAHEAGDAYMGFAPRDELVAFLNTLLEAERAGARICQRTAHEARDAGNESLAGLMAAVRDDEAHWCAVLSRAIRALDAEPSSVTGAFYEKAAAIPDLQERVKFINRGQGWVVRELRKTLPRIRDDALHAQMKAMLDGHEANIAKAS
jgi:methylphosphotriester-DNA--protein-cysteine methyltransferase